ncbi:hypothetical protein [Hyphomicrobium sp.]|uniref:hypothetical protein n=1 Tax=Hyphomicrobium sp. TaxID=82 RepID=UPI002D7803E2|nr:hypothetical protein [Hyphomicrobium sp.]HET6390047.1 hypothetical protein [Hyphomicrobium sp.]
MSKGKQLWPGDEMAAFFRAHIDRETALDAEAAGRLAAALTKSINRMLVREMPPAPSLVEQPSVAEAPRAPAPAPKRERSSGSGEAFNPYRFSAMVTLAKHGREGLMKSLQEIKSAENLRALAEAQHVPVAPTLKRTDDIRKAIIAGVERRLADRKAAAS